MSDVRVPYGPHLTPLGRPAPDLPGDEALESVAARCPSAARLVVRWRGEV